MLQLEGACCTCGDDVLLVSTLLPELPDVVVAPSPSLAPCFVLFCGSAAGLRLWLPGS